MNARRRRSDDAPFTKSTRHVVVRIVVTMQVLFLAHLSQAHARMFSNDVAIASQRNDYDSAHHQRDLRQPTDFTFERFQSPTTIQKALQTVTRKSPFQLHKGKDGRIGYFSCTKLDGDWVLAESRQEAVKCTTREVLQAYLSGDLQQKWNSKEVLKCTFHCLPSAETAVSGEKDVKQGWSAITGGRSMMPQSRFTGINIHLNRNKSKRDRRTNQKSFQLIRGYYQQDLVLRSQRIIRSHTGIMRYSQILTIDKIGNDSYSVLVRLDPEQQTASTTRKRPFESLSVYVGLQQKGENVDIYAAGLMKVNRKVVPNLLIFDASGIAGSMAGKGTLWLAGYFDQRSRQLGYSSNE